MQKPVSSRTQLGCLAGLVVVILLLQPFVAAEPYSISVLPGGYQACAITEDGVLCTIRTSSQFDPIVNYDTYLWRRGVLTLVAPGVRAYDGISGRVLGVKYNGDSYPPFHVLFENDTLTRLFYGSYTEGAVNAINSSGTAVGMLRSVSPYYIPDEPPTPYQPIVWQGTWPACLRTLGGDFGCAKDINNAGDIVGVSETTSGLSHACLWSNDNVRDIGSYLPGECLPSVYSTATRINEKGDILVMIYPTSVDRDRGHCFSFLLTKSQYGNEYTQIRLPLGFAYSYASGLNNLGQVVGKMSDDHYYSRAFIWSDGVCTDINSLIPAEAGCVVTNATDIDDTGAIIGSGTCNGELGFFVLTPVADGIPTITSFSPTAGGAGTTVNITGTNLTDAAAVQFNGIPASSYTVNSPTSITAVVPVTTSGRITIAGPGGVATSACDFAYPEPPTIASFTPTSGVPGCRITLTGTNFAGATAVSVGGVAAHDFGVISPTSIWVSAPESAIGPIAVTTPVGSCTSAQLFTSIPVPTIASPTSADSCDVTVGILTLAGVAPAGTRRVTWSNTRGGFGACTGTTMWRARNIKLALGRNILTVTATNAAGQATTDSLAVTFTDVGNPKVTIKSPTSRAAYSTTRSALVLSGSASDNVALASVAWTNAANGTSGFCTGTTSWKAPLVPLALGLNNICVTATDSSGSFSTAVIAVTCTDRTKPRITITGPTTSSSLAVRTSTLSLYGTASDDFGVAGVSWTNDRGGSGACLWSGVWNLPGVQLLPGRNKITVTAHDVVGNTATDTLTVTYTP